MSNKELQSLLAQYPDDAEVIVAACVNADEYTYFTEGCYDTSVVGNKDIRNEYFGIERNPESDEVYIKVYR